MPTQATACNSPQSALDDLSNAPTRAATSHNAPSVARTVVSAVHLRWFAVAEFRKLGLVPVGIV